VTALRTWQTRLEAHFSALRDSRPKEWPIFGLEHGLNANDIEQLKAHVKTDIARRSPSAEESLVWVVYAAEFGYLYSGEEYWQTFEKLTPGWLEHGDRYWIRRCFSEFHRRYRGAQPSGPWAGHFSIICWPITHAILPRDLQMELARILYVLRYNFRPELFESPRLFGEYIRARSSGAISRFRNFVEEPTFVGQIAAALLLPDKVLGSTLILSSTLNRITADLDGVRRSRLWLRDARAQANKLHVTGLRSAALIGAKLPGRDGVTTPARIAEWREQVAALAIEPQVVLRPRGPSLWDVLLQLEDLSPLLLRYPRFRATLEASRCWVTGAASRSPLARGRLLHGSQKILMGNWPEADAVLLRFEQSSPEIDFILSTACLLRPGPTWLFKVGSDDLAHEVRSGLVRPGQRYVVLSTDVGIRNSGVGTATEITCDGVIAIDLDLPMALTEDLTKALHRLGLTVGENIAIWPAGIMAADWDGEGRAEWVYPARPCLGVRADFPVDNIELQFNDISETLAFRPDHAGASSFIQLLDLPLGIHTLSVRVTSSQTCLQSYEGLLQIIIREPRAWDPRLHYNSALQVLMNPASPTLEQLWSGNVSVEFTGPEGSIILPIATLSDNANVLVRKRLPELRLPVDSDAWTIHFSRHFQNSGDVQNAYDFARLCEIDLNAGELGRFSFRCAREFAPVRWAVRHSARGYFLTLFDDTGLEMPTQVYNFLFQSPDRFNSLNGIVAAREFKAPENGGLFFAKVGGYSSAVILPPRIHTPADLRLQPQLEGQRSSPPAKPIAIVRSLDLYKTWADARTVGNIAALSFQTRVLKTILRKIFEDLCGDRWRRAEVFFDDMHVSDQAPEGSSLAGKQSMLDGGPITRIPAAIAPLVQAIGDGQHDKSFSFALARRYGDLASADTQHRIGLFAELVRQYYRIGSMPCARGLQAMTVDNSSRGPDDPKRDAETWLSEFALRTASAPETLSAWAADDLQAGVACLLATPAVARAARFLTLSFDRIQESLPSSETHRVYGGWRWA